MKQLIRFSIVGGLNTLLTTGLYLLLVYLGVYYHLALVADYTTGIIVGYLLNRHWTFASREDRSRSFPRYVASYLAVYTGNAVLLTLIVEEHWLGPLPGQLVALAIVSMASFLLQKYWVFHQQGQGKD